MGSKTKVPIRTGECVEEALDVMKDPDLRESLTKAL